MSSRFLPVFIQNADYVLTRSVDRLQARQVRLSAILSFCTQYRRRGIAAFLQTADATVLNQDLQRSGAAFAAFLEWADETQKTASKCTPFYDAVACGDKLAAVAIARLSATTHHAEEEYEDDFLYIRILMSCCYLGAEKSTLGKMLSRYETLLAGDADPRFLICKAFIENRAEFLAQGLETLISLREDDYTAGVEADELIEDEWATEGKLFVEGMALVRLAKELGFPVEREYLFIPSIALQTGAISFDPSSWLSPA